MHDKERNGIQTFVSHWGFGSTIFEFFGNFMNSMSEEMERK